MNRNPCIAAFAAGAAAILWIGAGYLGSHPLALTMTAIIGAVYVAGALELKRFHAATESLSAALAAIPENLARLDDWLDRLHPSLQNAVRLRIEGERAGLPGPALTPYLVGLLVMLGMLGTFLGLVVTLNGAVLALETTTDLPTIRAALAAPVKGLGLAFGTSVAGVAASAMLGLISALCRRQRQQAGQRLDATIAGELRAFSLVHQRQETFKALQAQSQALPDVVDKLAVLMAQLERQNAQLNERLAADQERFHREAKAIHGELAQSVDRSLKDSLGESARLAGAALQPAVEATLAGLAREATALHERMAVTAAAQLDGLAGRFEATAGRVADGWSAALTQHAQHGEALTGQLGRTLDGFAQDFAQRTAALLERVGDAQAALRADLAARDGERQAALTQSLTTMGAALRDEWRQAGEQSAAQQQAICRTLASSAQDIVAQAQAQTGQTLAEIARVAQASAAAPRAAAEAIDELRRLQAALAARDEERQAALAQSLAAMAAALRDEWRQAGEATLAQQQAICRTLETTAQGIAAHAEAHAGRTLDEIGRLLQTAAEAPRVAAEVIGELRQQLSASVARDNALLDERSRIMEGLGTLLAAINAATLEQRNVIESLVASAAAALDRTGSRFVDAAGAESARLADAAAQMTGSAVEVASLADAFAFAVQQFGDTSAQLGDGLARIEAALERSLARSDEQLAYYVTQARELIDLSVMSQQRIVDDLRRHAADPQALAAGVA